MSKQNSIKNGTPQVTETFDDLAPKRYEPEEELRRPLMRFKHSPTEDGSSMEIIKTSGESVHKIALVARRGTLEVTLANKSSRFEFWFANGTEGFTVKFFNEAGTLIDTRTELQNNSGEKEFKFAGEGIKRIEIIIERGNVIIDSISAHP